MYASTGALKQAMHTFSESGALEMREVPSKKLCSPRNLADDTFIKESMTYYPDEAGSPSVIENERPQIKEPPHYNVVLHNDDYTPMEFVIEVLQRYFHKNHEEAVQIMLRVHQAGRGLAGTYSHQIAETKVVQVHTEARTRGYPLQCSVEPVR